MSLLAGVVDKVLMEARYTSPHYAGAVAYTMFLQRFQKLLGKRQASGDVVFDDPAGKSPGGYQWRDLLTQQHGQLKRRGCPYTRATFRRMGSLSFVDSRDEVFVQVADLVAYNTFRQFRDHGSAWEDSTLRSLPLYRHFAEVAPIFDRGASGEFAGFGVAKWPITHKVRWALAA